MQAQTVVTAGGRSAPWTAVSGPCVIACFRSGSCTSVRAAGDYCMCGRCGIKLLSQINQALGIQRGSWQIKDNFRVMPTDIVAVLRPSEGLHEASMMRSMYRDNF